MGNFLVAGAATQSHRVRPQGRASHARAAFAEKVRRTEYSCRVGPHRPELLWERGPRTEYARRVGPYKPELFPSALVTLGLKLVFVPPEGAATSKSRTGPSLTHTHAHTHTHRVGLHMRCASERAAAHFFRSADM